MFQTQDPGCYTPLAGQLVEVPMNCASVERKGFPAGMGHDKHTPSRLGKKLKIVSVKGKTKNQTRLLPILKYWRVQSISPGRTRRSRVTAQGVVGPKTGMLGTVRAMSQQVVASEFPSRLCGRRCALRKSPLDFACDSSFYRG